MKDDGQRVAIARDGGDREAATVLVYLPGLGERGDVFEGLISAPALAGLRHIALDYVDWATSTPPRKRISFESVADRVAAWIKAHAQRKVVLVGHSMGGVIGEVLAERYPDLVAKLVDIEGNICRDDCTFSGKAVACSVKEFTERGFDAFRRALSGSSDPRARVYAEGLGACAPTTYYAYAKPLVRISEEEILADRLAKLPMPVLYIAGEHGISKRSREMLKEAGCRFKSVKGAGHWTYLDQPDRFIDLLRAFVQGRGPRRLRG